MLELHTIPRPSYFTSRHEGRETLRSSTVNCPRRKYWWSAQNDHGGKAEDDKVKDAKIAGTEDPGLERPSPLMQYRQARRRTFNVPRRIHILGVGNIGGFVAHSLAGLPHRPPITLLLPSRASCKAWYEQGESVKLTTNGLLDTKSDFDVEYARPPIPLEEAPSAVEGEPSRASKSPNDPQEDIIHNLIVSVKAFHTVEALRRVAHRLTPRSSILFIQNGMGIVEEINELVFPDPANRPQYLLGVISHGIYRERRFHLVHGGHGTTALAILPRDTEEFTPDFEPSALYLIRTMTRTPVLAAVGFAPTDLLQLQIEKLAVNAVINPLTALLGCLNGDLLHQPSVSRVVRLLLAEISLVIRSLPELQGAPNVKVRFDIKRLEAQVIGIALRTAGNKSSTLQDISNGRLTEIEYITGYLIRRGEEVGIQCVLNFMLMHMIKAKERMEGERRGNLLPLEPRKERLGQNMS
ncbi:MAG: hypothetical protein LQ338_005167 [Usnochroma carphineum]|nr:MAG: hypothetical protein LQ338_005167 [Usnochroma carphineum]